MGDPLQRPSTSRRGGNGPVANHEQVLPSAFGDLALWGQQDGLVVAGPDRLNLGHLGVDVVAAALRCGRHGVRVMALPRRDHHPHPVTDPLVAQVGAPRPGGYGHIDRARQGVQSHFPVAQVSDRPDVAGRQAVDPHRLLHRVDQVVDRVGDVDAKDLCRPEQPLDVGSQPEHCRAPVGLVGPDPFEHTVAVVERVGKHVNVCVVPVDELAVHPDLGRLVDRHCRPPPGPCCRCWSS